LGAGRLALAAGRGVAGAAPSTRLAHRQVGLHVPHPRQVFDAVFRAPLLPAAGHSAIEGDFAVLDADGYLTGIDSPVIGQGVGGVFQDPLVGPGVTHRAVPSVAVVAFAPIVVVIVVAEPAGNGVGGTVEPVSLAIAAPGSAVIAPLTARRGSVIVPFAVMGRQLAARSISAGWGPPVGELRGGEIAAAEIASGEAAEAGLLAPEAAVPIRCPFAFRMIARLAPPSPSWLGFATVRLAGNVEPTRVFVVPVIHLTGAPIVPAPTPTRFELLGLAGVVAVAVIASICH